MTKYWDQFQGLKHTRSYDKGTSLSLAIACDLAYEKKTTIRTICEDWGFTLVEFVDVRKGKDIDTQGFVAEDENNVLCVFRGSESIEDWLANFQAVYDPGPLKDTKAHEGFQDALYPAVIALTNALDSTDLKSKKLWLTGHSLGGALSSLYAGMLLEHKYPVYGSYTFASPRPADDGFACQLTEALRSGPHYRIVNDGDIVPHVPPEPFYSHPGRRQLISKTSRQRKVSVWTKWRKKMFDKLMRFTGKLLTVADTHRLSSSEDSYIPRLIKDLARPG